MPMYLLCILSGAVLFRLWDAVDKAIKDARSERWQQRRRAQQDALRAEEGNE